MSPTAPPDLGLHDIVLPVAPGWWPLPWSIWALLATTLLVITLLGWALHPRLKRIKRLKLAVTTWKNIRASGLAADRQILQLNQLFKRVAVASGYREAATLTGKTWADFLKTRIPEEDAVTLDAFLASLYRGDCTCDLASLDSCSKRWLRRLTC